MSEMYSPYWDSTKQNEAQCHYIIYVFNDTSHSFGHKTYQILFMRYASRNKEIAT